MWRLLLFALLVRPAPLEAQPCDTTEPEALALAIVQDYFQVDGAALWLEDSAGEIDTESYFGSYGVGTQVPIASASKLLSAIAILTLVDEGLIELDEPVSTYLPQFAGVKGTMTMRQLFSHTSGLPGQDPVLGDLSLTLEEAVDQIACCTPLLAGPGTQFFYGGVSMHVAGRVAEVVTGQSWRTLFEERVAIPLNLTDTDYDGFGVTENPRIAGGAQSTLRDYANALRMLRDGGVFEGQVVLTPEAVETMFADQTLGVPIVSSPIPDIRYGIGVWRDLVASDLSPVRISSPGAFGFTPWVEVDQGYAGCFMVQFLNGVLRPDIVEIQEVSRELSLDCLSRGSQFIRGDANQDLIVNISDPIRVLDQLFDLETPLSLCPSAQDSNDDGQVNIADAIFLLGYLFGEAVPELPAPFPACGLDETTDLLGCSTSSCR